MVQARRIQASYLRPKISLAQAYRKLTPLGFYVTDNKRSISGRIVKVGLGARPIPESSAVVTLLGPSPASCMTGADGTFSFYILASGNYTLLAGSSYSREVNLTSNTGIDLGDLTIW